MTGIDTATDRKRAAKVLADVGIRRTRTDVPADVVDAIDTVLAFLDELGTEIDQLTFGDDATRDAAVERRRDNRAAALALWEAASP